jgi:uncharacterized protein YaaR (DUF327 family)
MRIFESFIEDDKNEKRKKKFKSILNETNDEISNDEIDNLISNIKKNINKQ